MKKFLSAAIAALMIGAMAIPAVSAAPTASTPAAVPTDKAGTINLTKYETMLDANGNIISYSEADAAKKAEFVKVPGATFTATKVIALNADGSYSLAAGFDDIDLDKVIKTSTGDYTTYGTSTELEDQIAKMRNDIASSQEGWTQFSNDPSTTGDYTITIPETDLGVYLVEETGVPQREGHDMIVSTQAFLVSVPYYDASKEGTTDGPWQFEIEALPKNQTIDIDKNISDTAHSNVSSDSYAIGDIVPYTVTVTIPNYGKSQSYADENLTVTQAILKHGETDSDANWGVTRFNSLDLKFTDTLTSGLTFLPDSVEIKVAGVTDPLVKKDATNSTLKTAAKDGTVSGNADYEVVEDPTGTIAINVEWASLDYYQGREITLKYSAQLNASAVAGTENKNDVTVSFANDPNDFSKDADDPTRKTDTDTENNVYTYEMDLTKTFDNKAVPAENNADAAEVTFTLKDSSNKTLSFIKTADGKYTVWAGRILDKEGVSYAVPATYGVDDTAANYTPDGRIPSEELVAVNQLTADVHPVVASGKVTLDIKGLKDGTYTLTETKTTDGYQLLTAPVTIEVKEVKDAADDTVVTAEVSASVVTGADDADREALKANAQSVSGTDGHFDITVNNPKAKFFSLPTTGGIGLWIFTVGGGVIMAGAIIFITVLRKKRA